MKVDTTNYVDEERANRIAKSFAEYGWNPKIECLTHGSQYVVYAAFHGDYDYDIAIEFVDTDIYFKTVGGREIHWETMASISKAVRYVYAFKGSKRKGGG